MTLTGLIGRICIDLVVRHMPGTRDPLRESHPWYVLVELSDSGERSTLDTMLEEALGAAAEATIIRDAAISDSASWRRISENTSSRIAVTKGWPRISRNSASS